MPVEVIMTIPVVRPTQYVCRRIPNSPGRFQDNRATTSTMQSIRVEMTGYYLFLEKQFKTKMYLVQFAKFLEDPAY